MNRRSAITSIIACLVGSTVKPQQIVAKPGSTLRLTGNGPWMWMLESDDKDSHMSLLFGGKRFVVGGACFDTHERAINVALQSGYTVKEKNGMMWWRLDENKKPYHTISIRRFI